MNNIKYTLENSITFEELCEIVCMAKRQGYQVNDYAVSNEAAVSIMNVYISKGNKSFCITSGGYDISMSGYTPEEALDQLKCIMDKIGERKNEK